MSSPTITLQSVTGVDVELRIAGPGSRSYAFVIDWHIRFIVALGWFFTAMVLYTGSFWVFDLGAPDAGPMYMLVVLPPTLIYFLYHPVLEIAMRGRTPGKRMAGVRLVSRSGDIPGRRRAAVAQRLSYHRQPAVRLSGWTGCGDTD